MSNQPTSSLDSWFASQKQIATNHVRSAAHLLPRRKWASRRGWLLVCFQKLFIFDDSRTKNVNLGFLDRLMKFCKCTPLEIRLRASPRGQNDWFSLYCREKWTKMINFPFSFVFDDSITKINDFDLGRSFFVKNWILLNFWQKMVSRSQNRWFSLYYRQKRNKMEN